MTLLGSLLRERSFLPGQTSGQIFETPEIEIPTWRRRRLGAIKGTPTFFLTSDHQTLPFGFEIGKIVKYAGLNCNQLDLILGKKPRAPAPPKPSALKITKVRTPPNKSKLAWPSRCPPGSLTWAPSVC